VLLLLADDHALVREGLKHSLRPLAPDLRFVEAADAAEVMAAVTRHGDLDLALLDLVMPGNTGFDLLAKVCDTCPELPVVMLSASGDPQTVRKALDIGAAGFVTKSATAAVMLSALRRVLAGGIYVPPEMLGSAARTGDRSTCTGGSSPAASRALPTALTTLTARQMEVLGCVCQGKSNKQIARELDMSGNTVKSHLAAIFRTLGVDNRTQAAVVAREHGLFGNEEPR
jgi:DNA-binding NarL/FixJ family response regulator